MPLTHDEKMLVELLGDAFNWYVRLPPYSNADVSEFSVKIHDLQTRVMSRAAIREHPDIFGAK